MTAQRTPAAIDERSDEATSTPPASPSFAPPLADSHNPLKRRLAGGIRTMTRPWKFALAFFALGAFIIVAAFGVLVWAGWRESRVPGRTVLDVDFSAPYPEQRPEGPFGAVFDRRMRLRDVVEAL